jgi:hypothetical protein
LLEFKRPRPLLSMRPINQPRNLPDPLDATGDLLLAPLYLSCFLARFGIAQPPS